MRNDEMVLTLVLDGKWVKVTINREDLQLSSEDFIQRTLLPAWITMRNMFVDDRVEVLKN